MFRVPGIKTWTFWSLGLWVLGFGVWGLGFGVQGVGFRVLGFFQYTLRRSRDSGAFGGARGGGGGGGGGCWHEPVPFLVFQNLEVYIGPLSCGSLRFGCRKLCLHGNPKP